jgi:hypothetical protein
LREQSSKVPWMLSISSFVPPPFKPAITSSEIPRPTKWVDPSSPIPDFGFTFVGEFGTSLSVESRH